MNLAVRPEALRGERARRVETELLDLAALEARPACWDRLAAEAAYPNPLHSRPVLAAHRACGLLDARLRFLAASADGGLRAILPFVRNGAWTGARRSHAVWLPPLFAVNGTPLVAAHGIPEAIDGLLDGMAAAGALWRLPMLSIDGRIGRELTAACARRGFPVEAVGSFERAVLHRRAGYEAYARDRLSPNRRKGLRRRLKRLEAQGRVAFATFTEGEGLRQAVEAFLALEAAGWKGRRGTALAARDPGAPLTRALFSGPGACASSRADVLMLAGRPIAVSLRSSAAEAASS